MKQLSLLMVSLLLMSASAHSAMDEVSDPRLPMIKEQISEFSKFEVKSIYDGGTIAHGSLVGPNMDGEYQVTLSSSGESLASFMVSEYVSTSRHNQAYIVKSEHDDNWLCMLQNEPFNNCYKIINKNKVNKRICLEFT